MAIEMFDSTTFGPRALSAIYQTGNKMLGLCEGPDKGFQKNYYGIVDCAAQELASTHDSLMGEIEKLMKGSGDEFIPSFSLQAALDALKGYALRLGQTTIFENIDIEKNFWADLRQLSTEMITHDHARYFEHWRGLVGI